jgi:uncharacterized membrane protein
MTWLFAIGGAILGAATHGFFGMLAFGFVGWVFGMIAKSIAAPQASQFDALSRRVEGLEQRLAKIEGKAPQATEPSQPIETSQAVEPPQPIEPTRPPPPEAAAPTPAPPRVPPEPAKPNFIVAWFLGGNTIVRVGLVILFFGLAFLVKYGVEHQLIPAELRIAAVAAAGIALLVVGWRLRHKRSDYALSLQGAGVAVLYLTVFGALRLYGMIPAPMAFVLLAAIAAFSAFLAIGQNSLALAVFGAAGGFLAPILASTGHGSHVVLFSYYLVLNAAIVAIAWFRAWRVLNVLGFLFTFLVGLAWGFRSYREELFDTTEPFLVAFFLMYVVIAILFARRQVAAHRSYVDGMIVFGVPIAAFGLQAGLMRGSEFGLAFSSVGAGALYLMLSAILRRVGADRWMLLSESFLALGTVFVSLAIPLALDARWTSAAWAIEGAAVVWMGVRQGRPFARAFGILLQLLAGLAFFRAWPNLPEGPPLANAAFIGMVLVAFAGLATHRLLIASAKEGGAEKALAPVFFLWGLAWWLAGGAHEIHTFVDHEYRFFAALTFATFTGFAFAIVARREHWEAARWPEWAFAPVLLLFAVGSFHHHAHPFERLGWIAWPLALAVHFGMLRYDERTMPDAWRPWAHAVGAIVVAMIGTMELEWLATEFTSRGTAWALSARIVAPAVVLLAIASRAADTRWPVGTNLRAYRFGASLVLLAAMAVWSLHINFAHGGGSEPLPYLPILNAIDLGHLLAIFAVVAWGFALRRSGIDAPDFLSGRSGLAIASAVLFIWLNAILLRTMHHWIGVAYQPHALMHSVAVQLALSIFWAALALTLMVIATRTARRAIWMVGAGLMAVVVVKLVLIDLSRLSGLERIISFIGVGVLMLVIGYFSPVPPRKKEVAA